MADFVDETIGAAGRWELSGEALEGLLQALGSDRNVAASRYELLRRKLTDFLAWRRCEIPEELRIKESGTDALTRLTACCSLSLE
jgi:hypothetical protein